MSRRTRIRGIARWTGVGLCFVIVVGWGVCLCFFAAPVSVAGGALGSDSGFFSCGHVLYYYNVPEDPAPSGPNAKRVRPWWDTQRYVPPPAKRPGFDPRKWRGIGLGWQDFTRTYGLPIRRVFIVAVPYWLLLLLVAIPTALLFRRKRSRHALGRCRRCGYDLAGNQSGRCPECGTVVPTFRPVRAAKYVAVEKPPLLSK